MSIPTLLDYLPADSSAGILKLAQMEQKPPKLKTFLTVAGGTALGLTGGMVAGELTGRLLDAAFVKATGKPIPRSYLVIPGALLGAAAGAAYSRHQALEKEIFRNAHENKLNQREGRST